MKMDDGEAEDTAADNDPDTRISIMASDKRIQRDNEFSDSEEEDTAEGGRRNVTSHKYSKRARHEPNSQMMANSQTSVVSAEQETTTPAVDDDATTTDLTSNDKVRLQACRYC